MSILRFTSPKLSMGYDSIFPRKNLYDGRINARPMIGQTLCLLFCIIAYLNFAKWY